MSLSSRMYARSPNFCFLICYLTTPATYFAHTHQVPTQSLYSLSPCEQTMILVKLILDLLLHQAQKPFPL
ncbi:unnamed protein product, partial [Iphiclides podalirius]